MNKIDIVTRTVWESSAIVQFAIVQVTTATQNYSICSNWRSSFINWENHHQVLFDVGRINEIRLYIRRRRISRLNLNQKLVISFFFPCDLLTFVFYILFYIFMIIYILLLHTLCNSCMVTSNWHYNKPWCIRCHCFFKSNVRHCLDQSFSTFFLLLLICEQFLCHGTGVENDWSRWSHVFFDSCDDTGDIRIKAFDVECDAFYDQIVANHTFLLYNVLVYNNADLIFVPECRSAFGNANIPINEQEVLGAMKTMDRKHKAPGVDGFIVSKSLAISYWPI